MLPISDSLRRSGLADGSQVWWSTYKQSQKDRCIQTTQTTQPIPFLSLPLPLTPKSPSSALQISFRHAHVYT
jgi:hypothetical protein